LPEGQTDIFAKLQPSDYLRKILITDNIEQFSKPMLGKASTRENVSRIERLLGNARRSTQGIASELIHDMQVATNYPPQIEEIDITASEIVESVNYLISNIVLQKE